jgi:U3 small nucleolar RNA-associated protein 13
LKSKRRKPRKRKNLFSGKKCIRWGIVNDSAYILTVRCRQQDLQNYLLKKDYLNAILLAMSLEQPFRLLTLFDTVLNERPEGDTSITGSAAIDKILADMNAEQINKLLGYVRDWNTNAKRSRVAQTILNAILTLHSSEELVELSNAKEVKTLIH